MNKLDGKVAVITGGNSGIGLATAKEFARQGAKVVISGRDAKTLAEAEREIGGEVLAIQADVGKVTDIDKLYDAVEKRFGKIDVLFVDAGILTNRATTSFVVQRNGRSVTAEELAPLAFAGYAHFTAMQVRGGQVRGLDLHLERLRSASLELFGQALPDDQVRSYLQAALKAGPDDLSLMATVYSPAGEFTVAGADVEPEVLVRTGAAASGPAGPLTLATVEYERILPAVKHVGEVAKTYFLRQSVGQGFDDVAFVDRRGRLSEGSIWNLAFWDGDAVIWPVAEMLVGTTMGIVRRQLDRLGVPQRAQEITLADLPTLAGCVVMNSWTPGVAVHRIGSVPLPETPAFVELLHRAYQSEQLTAP